MERWLGRGRAWVGTLARGPCCPVTAGGGLGGSVRLDTRQLCCLLEDSWVGHPCLSGWLWSRLMLWLWKGPAALTQGHVLLCHIISGGPTHVGLGVPRLLLRHQCSCLIPPLFALSPTSLSPTSAHVSSSLYVPDFPPRDFWRFTISLSSLGSVTILFITLTVYIFVYKWVFTYYKYYI